MPYGLTCRKGDCLQEKTIFKLGVFKSAMNLHICKEIFLDGFNTVDSGFQVLGSGFLVSATWIPDFNRSRDSEILEVNSRFQSSGFWSPQANIFRKPGYLSDEKKPYKFYFRQIHYSFYDCMLEVRTKNDSYQVDLQT